MSMMIWKYILNEEPVTVALMPRGSRLISTARQGEHFCVWAEVDTSQPMVSRRIALAVTGGDTPGGRFIGTVMTVSERFIGHVYDLGESE